MRHSTEFMAGAWLLLGHGPKSLDDIPARGQAHQGGAGVHGRRGSPRARRCLPQTFIDICKHLPRTNVASLVFALVSGAVLVLVKELNARYMHKIRFPIPTELIVVRTPSRAGGGGPGCTGLQKRHPMPPRAGSPPHPHPLHCQPVGPEVRSEPLPSPSRRQGSGIWGSPRRLGRDPRSDPNSKPILVLHLGVCRWWWQQRSLGAVRCPTSTTCRSWERFNTGESRGPGSPASPPSPQHPPQGRGSEAELRGLCAHTLETPTATGGELLLSLGTETGSCQHKGQRPAPREQ